MTSSSKIIIGKILETILKLTMEKDEIDPRKIAEYSLIPESRVNEILDELNLKNRISFEQRVKLALEAIRFGVDGERISRYLDWKEFEKLAAEAFTEIGYEVYGDLRFKYENKRHQVDLLAYNGILMLLVDCKHWKKPPSPSEEKKMIMEQERRLMDLRDALNIIWKASRELREITLIPIILTIYEPKKKLFRGHMFISVGKLMGALEYLERSYYELRNEEVKVPRDLGLSELIKPLKKLK
ncbi:MAG TPA: hypothetical protein ENG18_00575 [Nitrososphaeria archaeon]|nr:hypothetical protein [Nitrososphaeria archaeon]